MLNVIAAAFFSENVTPLHDVPLKPAISMPGRPSAARATQSGGMQVPPPHAVLEGADALNMTQKKTGNHADCARAAATTHSIPVLDVVRAFDTCPHASADMGIGW